MERSAAVQGGSTVGDSTRRCVDLINSYGLHLRAAGLLAQVSRQFQAKLRVSCNGHLADGRSVLDLMLLGAERGSTLELEASGPDAEDAVVALSTLIEEGFHEDEESGDVTELAQPRDHRPE
jgi:phosphotransferase system HPr (HPr) family protein